MSEKTEFAGWWLWVTLLIVLSAAAFGAFNYLGLYGRTVAERVIFENSYQKHAADKMKANLLKAQLVQLERLQQSNPNEARAALIAGLRVQLSTTGDK
jgi:hypothetical protein